MNNKYKNVRWDNVILFIFTMICAVYAIYYATDKLNVPDPVTTIDRNENVTGESYESVSHLFDYESQCNETPITSNELKVTYNLPDISLDDRYYDIPENACYKKTWTNYNRLSRTSNQWEIQKSAYTNDEGLRVTEDGYYLVAMGTYYAENLGDVFLIELDNCSRFYVIICDIKSDLHTDSSNMYTEFSNCMLEFYVDDNLDKRAARSGDISSLPGFDGSIVRVSKVDI